MKTINLRVVNNFTQENIVTVSFPFDPYEAMFGFYSGWWRDVKEDIANSKKINKKHLKLKIWMSESGQRKGRTIVQFPSGAKADFPSPFDMKEKDWMILDLYLEAARLTLTA